MTPPVMPSFGPTNRWGIAWIVVAGLLWVGCPAREAEGPAPAAAAKVDLSALPMSAATLYFPNHQGGLSGIPVELPVEPLELRIHRAVELLVAGPDPDGDLLPILPKETQVAGVLVAEGVAYINLVGKDGGGPPGVGSHDEQMILYSLINSVVLNTPGVDRAVLLWNGSQRETFAGHYDTTRPLGADRALLQPAADGSL